MEDSEGYEPGTEAGEIIPIEQRTILFYERSIIVVRLPDDRPAVVIRSLCDNMQLDRTAQVRRIQRTAAIANDLVGNVRIETDGGLQRVQVLILRSVPYWLTGIDHKRVRPEMQAEVLRYQSEAVDVLYTWAQQPKALPAPDVKQQAIESATSITIAERSEVYSTILAPIEEPGPEATHRERTDYHELMSVWHRRQADLHAQAWRMEVEERIEGQEARIEAREAVVQLIPEVLERLGPEKVNNEQQTSIRGMVKQLTDLSGTPYQTIYWELAQAFQAPRYEEIQANQYSAVCEWFKPRIEAAKKSRRE